MRNVRSGYAVPVRYMTDTLSVAIWGRVPATVALTVRPEYLPTLLRTA